MRGVSAWVAILAREYRNRSSALLIGLNTQQFALPVYEQCTPAWRQMLTPDGDCFGSYRLNLKLNEPHFSVSNLGPGQTKKGGVIE
jgi:hypothetical protein